VIFFDDPTWTVLPVILPLSAAIFCFLFRRLAVAIGITASLANGIAVTMIIRQLLLYGPSRYNIGGWAAPLGIGLRTDGPGVLMLAMTAATGFGITLYARGYFLFRIATPKRIDRHERQEQFFWPLWMMLWAALNGQFLANDIFNLYVLLELVGISAAALAALSGKPASQIAAFRYLLVSLLGSLCYLLGVVFLYRTYAVLDLDILRGIASAAPGLRAALALISVGLLLKTALFPMHFWLPPAHANALAPVSAILSGLVVKGSFYLIFRFWFDIFSPVIKTPALDLLGILGAAAILWGAVQAMRQQRLKLLVAYSTVSQLGYLFIAFPLARIDSGLLVWKSVLFMALAHACAKSALFMAAGTIYLHLGHDRIKELTGVRAYLPITVFAYAIAGVNLMGLPPSGGFIAKWLLLTSSIASNQWWWGLVIMAGSLLASVYVYRVVSRLFVIPPGKPVDRRQPHSTLLEWPALALALLSMLLGIFAPYPMHILTTAGTTASVMLPGGMP